MRPQCDYDCGTIWRLWQDRSFLFFCKCADKKLKSDSSTHLLRLSFIMRCYVNEYKSDEALTWMEDPPNRSWKDAPSVITYAYNGLPIPWVHLRYLATGINRTKYLDAFNETILCQTEASTYEISFSSCACRERVTLHFQNPAPR